MESSKYLMLSFVRMCRIHTYTYMHAFVDMHTHMHILSCVTFPSSNTLLALAIA